MCLLILESTRDPERWKNTPRHVADGYADNMNKDGLIRLAICLRERLEEAETARKENDRRISELTDRIFRLTELLRKSNESMSARPYSCQN